VATDRAHQKATRRRPISASREQKVHRVTIAINGTVQILPFAADLDVGLLGSSGFATRSSRSLALS
jgi:hypothetical protein